MPLWFGVCDLGPLASLSGLSSPLGIKKRGMDDFCQPVSGKAGARSGAPCFCSYASPMPGSPPHLSMNYSPPERTAGSLLRFSQVALPGTLAWLEHSLGNRGCVISSCGREKMG